MRPAKARALGGFIGAFVLLAISLLKLDHEIAKKREFIHKKASSAHDFMKSQENLLREVGRRPELLDRSTVVDALGKSRRIKRQDIEKGYRDGIARYNQLADRYNAIPGSVFFRKGATPKRLERYIEPNQAL